MVELINYELKLKNSRLLGGYMTCYVSSSVWNTMDMLSTITMTINMSSQKISKMMLQKSCFIVSGLCKCS